MCGRASYLLLYGNDGDADVDWFQAVEFLFIRLVGFDLCQYVQFEGTTISAHVLQKLLLRSVELGLDVASSGLDVVTVLVVGHVRTSATL